MASERPIVEREPRSAHQQLRMGGAIISPCTGCRNNVGVDDLDINKLTEDTRDPNRPWPCPKQILYAQKKAAERVGDTSHNYKHPVYDRRLQFRNPIWPGLQLDSEDGAEYNQRYAYLFLAFYSDNDQSKSGAFEKSGRGGLNIDTTKIRCRGPYLLASTERQWNFFGIPDQGDTVLAFNAYYYVDGAEFQGYALEAATWQVANGYSRKIDSNLGRTLSGAARHS